MSISYQVLGDPGRDNAVFATVNTGQSQHRLLFDCGEECLAGVARADIQTIEVLFFSHFHIDHVAGFDRFFRANWFRPDEAVTIFGPPGAIEIIHHRIQGYTWNLVEDSPGEVQVSEIHDTEIRSAHFRACEGFTVAHPADNQPFDGVAYQAADFQVEARAMHHGTPSMAYLLREKDRSNVDLQRLASAGWTPGPWLKALKDPAVSADTLIQVNDAQRRAGDLRDLVLVHQSGESLAYLTDFCLDSREAEDALVKFLEGCKVIICENNFRADDVELAKKSFHMVSTEVGKLAARAQPDELILFHLSERYTAVDWLEQLAEVRQFFASARFPPGWNLDLH